MGRNKVFDEKVVLEKALNLFWEKGYNGTSAQDLVDTLGISRSSLYDTFGDKYQLFKTTLLHYQTQFAGSMIEMIDNSDNCEETLKKIFQYVILESIQQEFSKGCFMVNSSVE